MTKTVRFIWSMVLILCMFCIGTILADKQHLQNEIIRLHVLANSDSETDQQIKLCVRDAVTAYLENSFGSITDVEEAKKYIRSHLSEIQILANKTLESVGSRDQASVYLTKEKFGLREYDTFSLPSGVYDSLRIDIGAAEGKNWWCVVFPSLCIPASSEAFRETAISSGFDDKLAGALSYEDGYEVRFFLLDCFGRLENLFFSK